MSIDRVTNSLIKDFLEKFNFPKNIDDSQRFEHFVNYTILEKFLEERLDVDTLEIVNIGKNGTIGLDGFCILINNILITSIDDLKDVLESNKKPAVDVFFIQAKTENKFSLDSINSFGSSVDDFVSEEQRYNWNNNALDSINLFKYLIENTNKLSKNPNCHMYYVTLGQYSKDKNIEAVHRKIEDMIQKQGIFSEINLFYKDANSLQSDYRKIGQKVSRKFNFKNKQLIPSIEGVQEAYIGIVPVQTIVDLIEDDGELMPSIFYDNVRDYQGENKVNSEIKKSIEDDRLKFAFSILNNGITIVAESISLSRDDVTIENYQIVNGLQTSRVLYDSKDLLVDGMYVPIKLIVTQDEFIVSKVIRSTNRQTEVKEEDLIAFSDFQKKLEDYFKIDRDSDKLYYERRSKQYNNIDNIEQSEIIGKSTLIKVMGSFYFMKPNLATRYFGKLFREFGSGLFQDNHKLEFYYTAVLIYHRLEKLFANGDIDKRYRKLRYFLLMMVRLEFEQKNPPNLNDKKADKYCNDLLEFLGSEKEFLSVVNRIIYKLSKIENEKGLNYDSTEVSKSDQLVEFCKSLYLVDR